MEKVVVNAVGDQCPVPVVKATKALKALKGAGVVEVHVDNEIPVQNLTRLASSKGLKSFAEKKDEKLFIVTITADAPLAEDGEDGSAACQMDKRGNVDVAVATDHKGHGNEELGTVLIKVFIYALSQLDELPKTILFYNGGATLTTEGSESLEDLKSMEAQGVEILTCGTCLDYYNLKDKLVVGGVTNMYTIVEKLAKADRIIKQ